MTSSGSRTTSIGSRSQPRPTFFIDRSLGPHFAEVLKRHRYRAVHMREKYDDDGQWTDDEDWVPDAALRGWLILTQDFNLYKRPHQRQMIIDHGAKVFCLHKSQLREAEKGINIGRHLLTIVRHAARDGPCFARLNPVGMMYDISGQLRQGRI